MKTESQFLPNGLPLYKLMRFRITGEKCQVVKVNPEVKETNIDSDNYGRLIKPVSVNIKIQRFALGIPYYTTLENISQYDIEVWNEKMSPDNMVQFRTKKGQFRQTFYKQTM